MSAIGELSFQRAWKLHCSEADLRQPSLTTHCGHPTFRKADIQRKGKGRGAALFGGASLLTAGLALNTFNPRNLLAIKRLLG